ncbi:hypothetical protein GCM10022243_25370 [Saccharothrix violaceirubra]|uniref:Zinc finger protein n=1 Tax=Saccharothrix violaceirubra TaxID=413306 RepID=A0A7W7WTV8_9PSEU|nr:zinc finger protein [Saccharothrix violaceirubra]MBB4963544.1 hypothetical protein [Saccharothrix violaceirubra]
MAVDPRDFRWLPHDGNRHAIPYTLSSGETGSTLCGLAVTVPRRSPPQFPDGCWPTCETCDASWRRHEGIPLFSERRTVNGRRPTLLKRPPTTVVIITHVLEH